MKRVNNIYHKICNIDSIMEMYDRVIKVNTKNKEKIEEFENHYSINIKEIKEELITKTYNPGFYNIFLIKEPKLRIIMSQEIKDKIINHLAAKYFLVDVFDKSLISRNCATRVGKGTHYAMRIFRRDYNYYKNKYKTFYILKMDISKYFYSLDHDVIKNIIRNKIKDKDALNLLYKIIDSTNETYVNDTINNLKRNELKRIANSNCSNKNIKIAEVDKLPCYNFGCGACIGNMVSQIIATIYLDKLDKYIVYTLGFKHYARYMDDFYIMCEDKKKLQDALIKIDKILKEEYKLTLNNKTKIYKNTESIEFLGFRYSSKNGNTKKRLTKKTKDKFKGKMKRITSEFEKKNIAMDRYRAVRNSYHGHLKYGDCYGIYQKYVKYHQR